MRKRTSSIILALILATLAGLIACQATGCETPLTVVQWTNGHLMRTGLMKEMAVQFNQAKLRTQSGKLIRVQIFNHGSAEQSDDLISRLNQGVALESEFPNPTVVTPSSADWLVRVNHAAGRTVVDLENSRSIARALIGIVTYQAMAECLGWPDKEIGYADIIALRDNPQGWASYPGAKAEWGQRPLVAFTDPISSTTGRSVLFSLYAMAADKAPEDLKLGDVTDPDVIDYVKDFQTLIDHYMIGTIPLNTKIYQGPRYGHFFLMPEDNLIHLYEGTERAFIDGVDVQAPPIEQPMVMIYPEEGSMVRNNIAGIVQAPWVTEEQKEAAEQWINFLLDDERQRAFMGAGFRPGSDLSLSDPASKISGKYGLNPVPNTQLLTPEKIDPAVATAIENSWQDVKKPGMVAFVMDVSGSMSGTKITQAKEGIARAVDNMATNNHVGLITFSTYVEKQVPIAPLTQNQDIIKNAARTMKAGGNTALYDAVRTGIEMVDKAPGETGSIRAVVVMTDGHANCGQTGLNDIIKMISYNEIEIQQFRGFEDENAAVEIGGTQVGKSKVIGSALAIKTDHPVQIFFIGIGDDADMEVGRMLAQASGAEFQGVADKDLAKLLAEFSKYF